MWKCLPRVNTADWHCAACKMKTDVIFEHEVQTQSIETSTLRGNVKVKGLSLTSKSCILALRCPRTIAGDEHITWTIWLIFIDVPQRTDFTLVHMHEDRNKETKKKLYI